MFIGRFNSINSANRVDKFIVHTRNMSERVVDLGERDCKILLNHSSKLIVIVQLLSHDKNVSRSDIVKFLEGKKCLEDLEITGDLFKQITNLSDSSIV
ncbi:MAG: hypothetical protein QG673_2256, partial [Pseudomonadota bacterium]|nr:hypothetical protein [Pseudomonadota bacterium]